MLTKVALSPGPISKRPSPFWPSPFPSLTGGSLPRPPCRSQQALFLLVLVPMSSLSLFSSSCPVPVGRPRNFAHFRDRLQLQWICSPPRLPCWFSIAHLQPLKTSPESPNPLFCLARLVLAPKCCTSFLRQHPLPLPPQLSINAGEREGAQLRLIRQCSLRSIDDPWD